MSKFAAKVRKRVLDDITSQHLTNEELAFMLAEFERVARLDKPEADYTMEPIAQTGNQWWRQRPLKDGKVYSIRNIIHIDRNKLLIELIAILRKTAATYDIAEHLWDNE